MADLDEEQEQNRHTDIQLISVCSINKMPRVPDALIDWLRRVRIYVIRTRPVFGLAIYLLM